MQDMHNNVLIKKVIAPVVVSDNTAAVGTVVDRAGFDSLEFIILTGTLADADATFTVLVEHADANFTGEAAVADAQLLGTEAEASFQFDDDGEVRKIGYRGGKRYVRLTITPANNSGSAPIAACAVLGHPVVAPVTQSAS